MMKSTEQFLKDLLQVMKYNEALFPDHKKKVRKVKKMLELLKEDPDAFYRKYMDGECHDEETNH